MKRALPPDIRLVAALLLLAVAAVAQGIEDRDFDAVADFSVTVKTLSQLDEEAAGAYGILDRFLLLDGTVTNIIVLDSKEESFLAQVELVYGEWIGLEEVRSYSCWVMFSGPRFFPVFPPRVPRNPPPGIIQANDRVLVVAKALQLVEIDGGEKVWVLQGVHARILH